MIAENTPHTPHRHHLTEDHTRCVKCQPTPKEDNTVNDLDSRADVVAFMESLGFEYSNLKYYQGFYKNEGTCEVTYDGAKEMYEAHKALYRKRLEAMMEQSERMYYPNHVAVDQAIPISVIEEEVKRFKV